MHYETYRGKQKYFETMSATSDNIMFTMRAQQPTPLPSYKFDAAKLMAGRLRNKFQSYWNEFKEVFILS